jgi:signal transduction histidine kinase
LQRFKAFLHALSRPVVVALLSLALTGAIGLLDYRVGYEFSLAIFYIIPVALVSWTIGKKAGIAFSILSAGAQFLGDVESRPPYVQPLIPLWKAIATVCFYLVLVWLVAAHKLDEERRSELIAELQDSAVLEERNRMAREIHDTLARGFTGILLQLEAARSMITSSPEEATKHVERAQAIARESLGEARLSVWALRPPALEAEGLVGAVQHFLDRITAGAKAVAKFSIQGTPYVLPLEVAQGLLRICQEAAVNALRHARASRILVDLRFDPSEVQLCVQDNGVGFDPQLLRTGKGFGLKSMRERAERMGAQLDVSSELGVGTRVVVAVRAPMGGGRVTRGGKD